MGKIREARTQLYRHFDGDDRLLYVGISLSTVSRLAQHRDSAPWFAGLAKVTVQLFETRETALEAEARAIAIEDPLYNRRRPPPGLYGPKISRDTELSIFNPDADCPKCGCETVDLKWYPPVEQRKISANTPHWEISPDPREHLRSSCAQCGYEWSEATLDSVSEEEAA
jgi:hypothetical protein